MAKKKGKKGKGKKKAKAEEENINTLTEVDKTFYELQITDLNRKLARLRQLTAELEERNLELEQKHTKLDEDRADVIAYLKRTLQEKQNEVAELQERLFALQEVKESEATDYEKKIAELENEYKVMREQLTSEIKLITGKLNALEEFRIQRDELMQRYEEQEKNMEEQEERHKQILLEEEKKYIISKDSIRQEMEKRLIELAAEFERANHLRIAASTQRVIKENIEINNEMDRVMETFHKLEKENSELKVKNKQLMLNNDLFTVERNKALGDAVVQKQLIKQLTKEHKIMTETTNANKIQITDLKEKERQLHDTSKREENLNHKIRILEQNLHASQCQESGLKIELERASIETNKLRGTLYEAIMSIKTAMKMHSDEDVDPALKVSKRESLLCSLLTLLTQTKDEVNTVPSLDTVSSFAATYAKGDLGFIPKVLDRKRAPPIKYHADTQVGQSFEELFKSQAVSSASGSLGSIRTKSKSRMILYDEVREETVFGSSASEESSASSSEPVKSKTSQILQGLSEGQSEEMYEGEEEEMYELEEMEEDFEQEYEYEFVE